MNAARAEHHDAKHPYHLVDPSPWPIVGAIAAGALTFGMVMYMHPDMFGSGVEPVLSGLGLWTAAPGIVLVLLTMVFWWRDVVREATFQGHHTPVVQLHHRYGMALFIASEVMFFVAFFWAFFNASLFPTPATEIPGWTDETAWAPIAGMWPPKGVETFEAFDVPFLNTLVLVSSGATVTWAHHALRQGDRRGLLQGLGLTIILGVLFTSLQAYEYAHAAFGFTEGIYPSTFFMATGFHGFHVIIGTCFLIVCWFRAINNHFTPEHHFGFEAAAWYWHFVDVVWLFLFTSIYWWGS
jgi:cytochrome c oxidase subunit 3